MKILVIDDDLEILELLNSFFESLGHTVKTVSDSIEGLKLISKEIFDILFLDIKLPEKDGIEVLKEAKNIDPQLPVVMITGYKEAEKVIEAFRHGAIDCLLKPFNFEYIKNNVLPQIIEREKQ
jgi:DNA-binding NtrC family response regulator